MEKIYDPIKIESSLLKKKNSDIFFSPHICSKKNFCMMLPPPNITGDLHMGHAFQQSLMDVLLRYYHIMGYNTLLQGGTDHAGIAAQMIFEKKFFSKNIKLKSFYSKKNFLKNMWNWKNVSEKNIFNQMKRLGISLDWSDTRFTMDKNFSDAVNRVFLILYKDNLIYKKKKIVYWDTLLKTVVSDLEVNNCKKKSNLWFIKYKIIFSKNKKNIPLTSKYLIIATTRPETLLGDVAIAINPCDQRYSNMIGHFALVPFVKRVIPIIGDTSVDISQGTGCLKITPAHDFKDYEIAEKNKLPMINIFSKHGKIKEKLFFYSDFGKVDSSWTDTVPNFLKNLDRFRARKIIIQKLKEKNLLKCVKEHESIIPYGDRSHTILEPMLKNQWFIRMKHLSKFAIDVVKAKKISFFPIQYKKMFLSWFRDTKDWCISRQLWWGHRIPVWYDSNNNFYAGFNEKKIRTLYKLDDSIILTQDKDVLDTWFSSSLWVLSGLGWPQNTEKYFKFNPTNILISGFDIIFFWIARMIIMTMYITKKCFGITQIPFKKVYLTGLICDEFGKKMSKSIGNVLDPLDIVNGITLQKLIEKREKEVLKSNNLFKIINNTKKKFPNGIIGYGADSLRFSFLSLASTSRKINWDINRLKSFKFFSNKLWNASRFILMKVKDIKKNRNIVFSEKKNILLNTWILYKLQNFLNQYHNAFKKLRFDIFSMSLYDFFWNVFCDIYLELIKSLFVNKHFNVFLLNISEILLLVFRYFLVSLYPIMPFITVEIWKKFYKKYFLCNHSISFEKLPKNIFFSNPRKDFSVKFMNWFIKIIIFLKKFRCENKIKFNYAFTIVLKNLSFFHIVFIQENYDFLKKIAYLNNIYLEDFSKKNVFLKKFSFSLESIEIVIFFNENFDYDQKNFIFKKKIEKIEKKINILKNLLNKKDFFNFAPKNIIKKKQKELIEQEFEKKILLEDNNLNSCI